MMMIACEEDKSMIIYTTHHLVPDMGDDYLDTCCFVVVVSILVYFIDYLTLFGSRSHTTGASELDDVSQLLSCLYFVMEK